MRRFTVVMFLAVVANWHSTGWAKGLSDVDRGKVAALYEEGVARMKAADSGEAMRLFQAAIQIDEKHAPSYVGIGHIYLGQRDFKSAEKAFKDARRRKHDYAPAYHGLGMMWRQKRNGMQRAIEYFQKALQYDRGYLDARYQIAEMRFEMKEHDVKREAEKLIKMDASFAPAYWLLGEWYETFKSDYEQAAINYNHYLSLRPEDSKVTLLLAGVHGKTGEHQKIVELLQGHVAAYPDSIKALPVLALAYMELDSLERAEFLYEEYLERADPAERELYEDIRLLSSSEEYKAYRLAPDPSVFLVRFWGDRDPDLTTPANERKLEHYRRVWYALHYFSEAKQPWDTRGDIYVRFGEPDHRSRSDWQNFQQTIAVQRVKEKLAADLGYPGDETYLVSFPVRSQPIDYGGFKAPTYSPIMAHGEDPSMVPWESWVFAGVAGGMEVTFTDELQNGTFDYAPSPVDVDIDIRKLAAFNRMSPRNVSHRAAVRTPNYYRPAWNEDPLEFYYDLADFRGQGEEESALEVYVGIPQQAARYDASNDSTWLEVDRTVGVLNEETGAVYRVQGNVRFQGRGNVVQEVGAYVPDVVRIDLPPGPYRMEVKVVDRQTGRRARYRQKIDVETYGESGLLISDLEMAWRITEDIKTDKFMKGNLHVVPMPTRTYGKGHSVYVYYEVYNLMRDTFGQTRYRVAYTVGKKDDASASNIARLVRLSGGRREEVAVAYEQRGTTPTEVEYVALELGEYKEGKQSLQVEVTDLNSGEKVVKEAVFVVR